MTGLRGPVLRFMRVDAQSERLLSPPAVGRNAHDLKTCVRLSFCVRTSYKADACAAHSPPAAAPPSAANAAQSTDPDAKLASALSESRLPTGVELELIDALTEAHWA